MMGRDAAASSNEQTLNARSRRRDLFEVVLIYGLILVVLWTPAPWQLGLWVVAAAAFLAIISIRFDGLKPMGLCSANFFHSFWAVGAALAMAAVAVLTASRLHTLHVPVNSLAFAKHVCSYALWACLQQLVLQCFFLSRLLRLLPDARVAAGAAAVLFAFAHLPSPILTIVTLIWGLAACLFFLRYRNLYPLAIAHAILGTALAVTIPGPLDHNMEVGIGYITYVEKSPVDASRLAQP